MAPERNLGSERTKAALVKYEAPSMTSDLLAGRKAQENQWVKDTQNFLAIETLLYIYGLQAMKSHERNQVTLEHFENLVQMAKPPAGSGFRVAKLLVPFAPKDGEVKLTGGKVRSKAPAIKRDIKAYLYAGIWSASGLPWEPPSVRKNGEGNLHSMVALPLQCSQQEDETH